MIDTTFFLILTGIAFAMLVLGTWKREAALSLAGGTLILLLGLTVTSEGIGQTQAINLSVSNATTGNITEWRNSTETFTAGATMDGIIGITYILVGLALVVSDAIRAAERGARRK